MPDLKDHYIGEGKFLLNFVSDRTPNIPDKVPQLCKRLVIETPTMEITIFPNDTDYIRCVGKLKEAPKDGKSTRDSAR